MASEQELTAAAWAARENAVADFSRFRVGAALLPPPGGSRRYGPSDAALRRLPATAVGVLRRHSHSASQPPRAARDGPTARPASPPLRPLLSQHAAGKLNSDLMSAPNRSALWKAPLASFLVYVLPIVTVHILIPWGMILAMEISRGRGTAKLSGWQRMWP